MVLRSLLTSTSSQICTWAAEGKTLRTPKHSWNSFSEPRPTNIFYNPVDNLLGFYVCGGSSTMPDTEDKEFESTQLCVRCVLPVA